MAADVAPGGRRLKPSPFLVDIVNTGVTSLAAMASLVLVTRLLAGAFTTDEFGVWGLSRRLVVAVAIYSNVVGLALARYLAIATDEPQRQGYLLAASAFALAPGLALLGIGALVPAFWARLVFHDPLLGTVLVSSLFLILATASFNLLYAYYRGTGRVRLGNSWQVWVVGVVPAVVAWGWAHSHRVDLINFLTAAGMCTALVPVALALHGGPGAAEGRRRFRSSLKELLQYGLPRIPGGLAFGGLIAVGPFLAPRLATIGDAGYLVAGQSLLRIVEVGTAAFGVVALPRIAELHARGQHSFIRDRVEDLLAMAFQLGLFASIELLIWSDVIVRAWLGERYVLAIPIVRILMLSAVPYLGYTLLRSVIDAVDERAVNTRNTVLALVATIVGSLALGWAGFGGVGLAIAATSGVALLGALSVFHLVRTLHLGIGPILLSRTVGLLALLTAATLGFRATLPPSWPPLATLSAGIGFGAVAGTGFLFVLRWSGVRWIAELEGRLVRRGQRK